MDLTPYFNNAKSFLSKDIIVDGRVIPVKYLAAVAGTIVGLTAGKVRIKTVQTSITYG
jgi:hypothetical protein